MAASAADMKVSIASFKAKVLSISASNIDSTPTPANIDVLASNSKNSNGSSLYSANKDSSISKNEVTEAGSTGPTKDCSSAGRRVEGPVEPEAGVESEAAADSEGAAAAAESAEASAAAAAGA